MEFLESEQFNKEKEKHEKPAYLYLGTHTAAIKELTPTAGRVRDPEEGPVVFATPDKALASAFLVEGHNDAWMRIGYYDTLLVVVIQANRNDFITRDHGGYLYTVAGDKFASNPNRGLGEKERTSIVPVRPAREKHCTSALDVTAQVGRQS
jgi:hypothetical protein